MHGGILPTHVAMACPDNIACDGKCVFDRICEQLRANWWRHRATDLQVKIRSEISQEFCKCNGACSSLRNCYTRNMVGNATDGGGHQEAEASKDAGGEGQHGCFG